MNWRKFFTTIVSEKIVMFVIVLNSLILFLGAFPALRVFYRDYLFWIDYVCTIFFVFEAIIKIRLHSWSGYWASGWNKFDFLIVVASAPMLLSPFLNTGEFAIILILRIGRLLRFFKLARFIPNQEKLWSGIKRAIAASIGFLVTLCLYNFILAIGAAYLFADIHPEHFGDPWISVYSMFKVFTVEGWYEIPDAIAQKSSPLMGVVARCYFIFTVLTGGIIGLSIANAVFVDEMVMDNTDSIENKIDELTENFKSEIDQLKRTNQAEREEIMRRLETLLTDCDRS